MSEPAPSILRTSTFRLALMYVAAFVLAAALAVGALFVALNDHLAGQSLEAISAETEVLAGIAGSGGPAALTEAVGERSSAAGAGLYLLTDPRGAKLAGNLNRPPPELAGRAEGGLFRYAAREGDGEREHLAVALQRSVGDGLTLLVGRDLEESRRFVDRVKRLVLVAIGGLSLLGIAGGIAASRLLLGRVEAINRAARTIMAGDLAQRVPLAGTADEMDDLARNLNGMLERIEQLMAGLREVSDNIAHDLKTPLTRLRSRAEAALRDSSDPAALREGLARTIEDADELIKTFNALLLIARLEAGAVEASLEDIDLGDVVAGTAELYEPLAEDRGVVLTAQIFAGARVRANRQLLGQAVANLIDNAIKHAGPAADRRVEVSLHAGGAGPEIVVADRGIGIPAADRERVMKRFVRLDRSRTAPGTGLGLSLVAAVARLHGGTIRLEDNGPGLRVVLALPGSAVSGAQAK